jgi:hypothetical protein
MARWRLTQPHYLNVPGTEYRYEETDRETGEAARSVFAVPRFLHPENPRDCRSPEGCVVAYKGSHARGDWVFEGKPTPDMEPLDDEARKISEGFAAEWKHPIDSMESQGGFAEALLQKLSKQLDAAFAGAKGNAVSVGGVSAEEFAKLQEQVGALMAKNAELEAANKPKAASRR